MSVRGAGRYLSAGEISIFGAYSTELPPCPWCDTGKARDTGEMSTRSLRGVSCDKPVCVEKVTLPS